MSRLLEILREAALERGLAAIGATPATPIASFDHFRDWLDAQHHGEMAYMARDPERRRDPAALLPGTRSVVVVAANHRTPHAPAEPAPLHGRVARYAWGRDYHDVLGDDLAALAKIVEQETGGEATRTYVDTGAILERDAAARAGLGFVAKNTMLIRPGEGSHLFLGEILTTAEIADDRSPIKPGCGECTLCLDACPTGAITEPYVVDARKCISYLTIELKGAIPRALRPAVGRWLFGCDICQDCCPWNAAEHTGDRTEYAPADIEARTPHLPTLLALTPEQFRARFKGTPLSRPKRRGLLRNACVVLGNEGNPDALPALIGALTNDEEPLVRGHAAWAIGQIGGSAAVKALEMAAATEDSDDVQEELRMARASS